MDGEDQSAAAYGEKYYALHLYPDAALCMVDGVPWRKEKMGQKTDLNLEKRNKKLEKKKQKE